MACDSAWTNYSGCVLTSLNKLIRLSSGAVIGEAGDNDSRAVVALLDKVRTFSKMPSAKELAETHVDYAALIAFPNGEVAEISIEHIKSGWSAGVHKVNRGIAAVGTGGEIALGAMAAGKTAAEAVAISCQFDPHSRPPVHVLEVRSKPTSKPKKRRR